MSNSATFTCLTKRRISESFPASEWSQQNPRNSLPSLILNTGKSRGKINDFDVPPNRLTVSQGVTRIQQSLRKFTYSSTALTITCRDWHLLRYDQNKTSVLASDKL
jgi:hypothetical protein